MKTACTQEGVSDLIKTDDAGETCCGCSTRTNGPMKDNLWNEVWQVQYVTCWVAYYCIFLLNALWATNRGMSEHFYTLRSFRGCTCSLDYNYFIPQFKRANDLYKSTAAIPHHCWKMKMMMRMSCLIYVHPSFPFSSCALCHLCPCLYCQTCVSCQTCPCLYCRTCASCQTCPCCQTCPYSRIYPYHPKKRQKNPKQNTSDEADLPEK